MSAVARSPVLVGRAVELAAAARLVDGLAGGVGATLLVTGEAGVGKSRLVGEVAARATDSGLPVLTGRAVLGGGTYRAVAEALAPVLRGRLDGARPFRAALRGLLPRGADQPVSASGVDPAVVLGEAVLALVGELPGGRGGVLVLEDLHWADADTLGLVGYLAGALAGVPLLLVLTARTDVALPAITALAAHGSVTPVRLATLDAAGSPCSRRPAGVARPWRRPSWTSWWRGRTGCRSSSRSCSRRTARPSRRRWPVLSADGSRHCPPPRAR